MIFANDSQNLRRHATAEFVDFPGGDFRADFRRRQIHRRNRQRHDARDAAQRGGNGRQRGRVAAHDGEFHLAAKPFRVAPPVELSQLIRAENPKKIRARERVFEMLDRADRPAQFPRAGTARAPRAASPASARPKRPARASSAATAPREQKSAGRASARKKRPRRETNAPGAEGRSSRRKSRCASAETAARPARGRDRSRRGKTGCTAARATRPAAFP